MPATEMERKTFLFKIDYFKPNGKWYTEHAFEREVRSIGTGPYMHDVTAYIRGLRDSGSSLPGLSSTGWKGFIYVTCDDGFPCLILPVTEV